MLFNKYQVVSKVRFTIFLGIIVVLLTFVISSIATMTYVEGSSPEVSYNTITVESGDTLWSIAEKHAEQGTDIRKFIYEIVNINDLDTVILSIGQELTIPV